MRKSVIAGNWKMHMTCADAKSYLEEFIPLIKNTNKDLTIKLETFERSPDPIAGINFPAK